MEKNAYKILQAKIHSQGELLRANEKAMKTARLQQRCSCPHKDANGAISLNSPGGPNAKKSPITGAPLYMCRECGGFLDISQIPEEDFKKAMDVLVRVCDLAKMKVNCSSEKEQQLFNQIGLLQYQLQTLMPDLYNGIVKKTGGRKEKKSQYAGLVTTSRP